MDLNNTRSPTLCPKTTRLDIKLAEPDDKFYNSVNYAQLLNLELGKDIPSLDLLGIMNEDTTDRFKDYEEESYIDNSEVYRDTFPAGKEAELGGFYINFGKLRVKSSVPQSNLIDKIKKKKKISEKTKTVSLITNGIRKKESRRKPQFKYTKEENNKVKENHKMHSNIRLDTLLNTIRKQKQKGIVKIIMMPNASNKKSNPSESKIGKEICNNSLKQKSSTIGSKSVKKICKNSLDYNLDVSRSKLVKKSCDISSKRKIDISGSKLVKKICDISSKQKPDTNDSKLAKKLGSISLKQKSDTNESKLVKKTCDISSKQKSDASASKLKKKISDNSLKQTSDTSECKLAKEICKIIPKKKNDSTKKCSMETLSTTNVVLNSKEITFPIENFLSSKTSSCRNLSSSSDSAGIKVWKEILHTVHKNQNDPSCIESNPKMKIEKTTKLKHFSSNEAAAKSSSIKSSMSSKTSTASTSCKINSIGKTSVKSNGTSDTRLPSDSSVAISKKSPISLPDSTLDSKRTTMHFVGSDVTKNTVNSASKDVIQPDFINITPVRKTSKLSLPKEIFPNTIKNSTCKIPTDSVLKTNSSKLNIMVKPRSIKNAPIHASDSSFIITTAKGNSSSVMPRSETINRIHVPNSSMVTNASVSTGNSSLTNTIVMPRSEANNRIHVPNSSIVNNASVSTGNSTMTNTMVKNKPKANLPIHVSHSSFVVTNDSSFTGSSSTANPISKSRCKDFSMVVLPPSRKVVTDSSVTVYNPMSSMATQSNSLKVTTSKEMPDSSQKFTMESIGVPDIMLSMPVSDNSKESHRSDFLNYLTPNSTNPKTISNYMLNLIHAKNALSSSTSSIPAFPAKTQSRVFDLGRNMPPPNYPLHTYSKLSVPKIQHQASNKNSFQHVGEIPPVANCSVNVSQEKHTGLMNFADSSSHITTVNMHKMNISPIVKYK